MKKLLLAGACLAALTGPSWAAAGYGAVAVDLWKDSTGTHARTYTTHNDKSAEEARRIAVIGCEAQGARAGRCRVVKTFGPSECWYTTAGKVKGSGRNVKYAMGSTPEEASALCVKDGGYECNEPSGGCNRGEDE
jgi:hypothetical protein